jgi:hypothetical protein
MDSKRDIPETFSKFEKLVYHPRPLHSKLKTLPPLPPSLLLPQQPLPFIIPNNLSGVINTLLKPLPKLHSANSFIVGGESNTLLRLYKLFVDKEINSYTKEKTKKVHKSGIYLLIYLSHGYITIPQILEIMNRYSENFQLRRNLLQN